MLNIYYSQTINGCETEIFNSIKNNRGNNINHVIFTPDRRTQQTEQKLFTALNSNCFFDVNVITLTRFTSQIVAKHNQNKKVLTKPLAVAIIKKILNENEKEFKTFKKAIKFNGFSSTLFDTIAMFKSCGVSYDKLNVTTKNNSLNYKLEDIKKVYYCYEKFLGEDWTDSFNKLNLLTKLINKTDCENTHYYFLGFDDFTPQMYAIIEKLSKFGLSCNVATAVSYIDGINNKNIYLNNVYLNLLSVAQTNGIKINKIYCPLKLNSTFSFLSKNLLGYSNNTTKNENLIKVFKFNTISDEVKFATKTIINLCLKYNLTFDDIALITPSLETYKNVIKTEFEKNNITYFFDESEKIVNHIVLRFYSDLFNLISNNFLKTDVFNFLFNYSQIDKNELFEYENKINLSGLDHQKILEPIDYLDFSKCVNVFEKTKLLKNVYKKIKEADCFSEIINVLTNFFTEFGFNNYLTNLNKTYIETNNIVEQRKLTQVVSKVSEGLNDLTSVLGSYKTNWQNVFNIILAYFENSTIVVPPIINNSVFVADALLSYVPHKKYAIILGASDGNFPKVQSDLGIISDTEINVLKNNFSLSPTINVINKRNKFKVYSTLLNFDNLILSYVFKNSQGETILPCEAIKNITEYFVPSVEIINGSVCQQVQDTGFSLNENYFIFNNISKNYLKENLITVEKFKTFALNNPNFVNSYSNIYNSYNKVENNVNSLISLNEYKNNVSNITNAKQLFFNKDYFSISQFENYFNCAYKHFIDYGLRLKSLDNSEFNALEIGNILHEYVKLILPIIENNHGATNLNTLVNNKGEEFLKGILNKPDYIHLVKNPQNANDIKSLFNEIKRINQAIINERKVSKFKTEQKLLEMPFLETTKIKCGSGYLKIKGIIDRVDVCDNEFRIIDYKTGSSDFDDFTDIKCGKKIQLIVYAGLMKNKLKLQPVGAFYLPLKNEFIKENKKDLYKLKGIVLNSLNTILNMDSSLSEPNQNSFVLNIKTDKNGELKGGLRLSETEFDEVFNYVLDLIKSAINKLEEGNIVPNPLKIENGKPPCEYCPYIGLCGFSENHGNSYNKVEKIKTVKELINE